MKKVIDMKAVINYLLLLSIVLIISCVPEAKNNSLCKGDECKDQPSLTTGSGLPSTPVPARAPDSAPATSPTTVPVTIPTTIPIATNTTIPVENSDPRVFEGLVFEAPDTSWVSRIGYVGAGHLESTILTNDNIAVTATYDTKKQIPLNERTYERMFLLDSTDMSIKSSYRCEKAITGIAGNGKVITKLNNGNFVLRCSEEDKNNMFEVGWVALVNGETGEIIQEYIGEHPKEMLGWSDIVPLENGNFALHSGLADAHNGDILDQGGLVHLIDGSNGNILFKQRGSAGQFDRFGSAGVIKLSNDNILILSSLSHTKLIDGSTGQEISTFNLVGDLYHYILVEYDVVVLDNGNYIINYAARPELTTKSYSILFNGVTGEQILKTPDYLAVGALTNGNYLSRYSKADIPGHIFVIDGSTGLALSTQSIKDTLCGKMVTRTQYVKELARSRFLYIDECANDGAGTVQLTDSDTGNVIHTLSNIYTGSFSIWYYASIGVAVDAIPPFIPHTQDLFVAGGNFAIKTYNNDLSRVDLYNGQTGLKMKTLVEENSPTDTAWIISTNNNFLTYTTENTEATYIDGPTGQELFPTNKFEVNPRHMDPSKISRIKYTGFQEDFLFVYHSEKTQFFDNGRGAHQILDMRTNNRLGMTDLNDWRYSHVGGLANEKKSLFCNGADKCTLLDLSPIVE
jgi:hypothetical protein